MKEQWILEQKRKYDEMKDWFPSYTVSEHGLVLQHVLGFTVERCWDDAFYEACRGVCADCTYYETYLTKQLSRTAHELVFELEGRWLFFVFSCESGIVSIHSYIQNSKDASFNYSFEKAANEGLLPDDFVQKVRKKQAFFSDYFLQHPKYRLKTLTSEIRM